MYACVYACVYVCISLGNQHFQITDALIYHFNFLCQLTCHTKQLRKGKPVTLDVRPMTFMTPGHMGTTKVKVLRCNASKFDCNSR